MTIFIKYDFFLREHLIISLNNEFNKYCARSPTMLVTFLKLINNKYKPKTEDMSKDMCFNHIKAQKVK